MASVLIEKINKALAEPENPHLADYLFVLPACKEILGDASETARKLWGLHAKLSNELFDYAQATTALDAEGKTTTGIIRERRRQTTLHFMEMTEVMHLFCLEVAWSFPERVQDMSALHPPVLAAEFKIGLAAASLERASIETKTREALREYCG